MGVYNQGSLLLCSVNCQTGETHFWVIVLFSYTPRISHAWLYSVECIYIYISHGCITLIYGNPMIIYIYIPPSNGKHSNGTI